MMNMESQEMACGVAVSMKLGNTARRLGVTVEVPVEDVQAMTYEELGADQASKSLVMIDMGRGSTLGSYRPLINRDKQQEWLPTVLHDQVIRLNATKSMLKGLPTNVAPTLRHELTHAKDFGSIGHKKADLRYKMQRSLVGGGITGSMITGALVAFQPVVTNMETVAAYGFLGFGVAHSVGMLAAYYLNPFERRAFRHQHDTKFQTEPVMIYASKSLSAE